MPDILNRKYVAVLCAAAFAILGIGAWLRPKKATPKPPSPSENANLQRMVRREELRNMGSFFGEKATSLAGHLRFMPETGASGVYWGRLGQILSAGRDLPLETIQTSATPTPPEEALVEAEGGRWVLLVWIEAEQQQLEWTAGIDGGRRVSTCDGVSYRELIVSTALSPSMRGAAVFDLDGILIGMVAQCDGAMHVVSAPSFKALLSGFADPAKRLHTRHGIAVERSEADGLWIAEVNPNGTGYLAGLRAGDKAPANVTTIDALLDYIEKRPPSEPKQDGLTAVDPPPTGTRLTVQPGSAAYDFGLRTGDRLIKPALPVLKRLIARPAGRTMVVYERNGVHFAKPLQEAPKAQ
ncbi:hypothetical protein F183_A09950 [Bryobacterales bacterium F-183]|nr:hypothetical protein F183_A09950 [Bryobacterales bacterium F-183]